MAGISGIGKEEVYMTHMVNADYATISHVKVYSFLSRKKADYVRTPYGGLPHF